MNVDAGGFVAPANVNCGWVGEAVHFVNRGARPRAALTFGTYTVRNVNGTPREQRVLT